MSTDPNIEALAQHPAVREAVAELTRRIKEHQKWIRAIRVQCRDPHRGGSQKFISGGRKFPPGGPTLPPDAVAAAAMQEVLAHAVQQPDPTVLFYKFHIQCTDETGKNFTSTLNLDFQIALGNDLQPGAISMHDSSLLGLAQGATLDPDDVDVEEPLMRILDRSLSQAQAEKTRLFSFIMEREENYAKAQSAHMATMQETFAATTLLIRSAIEMMTSTHKQSERMLEIAAEKEIAQEEARQRARNIEQTIKAVTEQGLPILKMVLANNLAKANKAKAAAAPTQPQAPAQAPAPTPETDDSMAPPIEVNVTLTLPQILADLTPEEAAAVEKILGADLFRRCRDPRAWTVAAMSDLSSMMEERTDLFLELAEIIGPDRVAKVIRLYEELTGETSDPEESSDSDDEEEGSDDDEEGDDDDAE